MPDPTGGNRRVVFIFDEGSYGLLQDMTRELGFTSDAVTIREAMRILRAIQKQKDEGYSDVIVENPNTFEQRRLMIEFLAESGRGSPG